ncbi:MAG: hypothetical protein MUQ65_15100 [Armatimonadetes bacterium]|nr:hypothetical protein [Armatimonadota bacterium]
MSRKSLRTLAFVVPLLVLLFALDTLSALQGLPLLLIGMALALVFTARVRARLNASERTGIAMLPFMAAALVLLFAFCRGRNLSQALLLLVTLSVVFDVLLLALAAIGEVGKRGAKGAAEFLGYTGAGIALGLVLSLVFLLDGISGLGGMGLAKP